MARHMNAIDYSSIAFKDKGLAIRGSIIATLQSEEKHK
jgi:hypothetical protein